MNKCFWCGKPATRLCDFPLGGLAEGNENGEKTMNIGICSKPICEDCATKFHGLDVCPKCFMGIGVWFLERKDRVFVLGNRRADNGKS